MEKKSIDGSYNHSENIWDKLYFSCEIAHYVKGSSSVFQEIFAITDKEATIQRCSYEKVFWKYAANLQKNTHVEVPFQ